MRILITILLLLSAKVVFADEVCKGKPIEVIYLEDRVAVKSEYSGTSIIDPGDQFDTKTYFPEKIEGKTKEDILQIIKNDIDIHCEQVVFAQYVKSTGGPLKELRSEKVDGVKAVLDEAKKEFASVEGSKSEASFKIDTDFDGLFDQKWDVKQDGTKTITDIIPTADPK